MGGGRLEGETIYLRPIAMEDTERIVTWRNQERVRRGIFIGEADAVGRGIGTQAARLAVAYARDVLGLHKLMLRVFADNAGAVKSYQRAGFVQEAYLKDEFRQNGGYRDMLLMAVIFPENA